MNEQSTVPTLDPLYHIPRPCPEKVLVGAILERAIRDATASGISEWPMISRARKWVLDWRNDHELEPFTFGWVCQALDLDPYEIQRQLEGFINQKETFYGATHGCLRKYIAA